MNLLREKADFFKGETAKMVRAHTAAFESTRNILSMVEARHANLTSFYGVVRAEIDQLEQTIAHNQGILNESSEERSNTEKLHAEAK